MITEQEVIGFSRELGVPLPNIEKDYVIGWLLWGIYKDPGIAKNLILKGGNCLRKIYFPDTRFSDDLDFTTPRLDSDKEFHRKLNLVCKEVSKFSGINFDINRTIVEAKETPDRESQALDGRVYFKGFAGDSSLTMRIKFDVTEYEKVVLPLQWHPINHIYSDADKLMIPVQTYSLEEVLAEKLRSWIQRTRSRDLFDVVKIIQSEAIPISKSNILSAFLQKTIFKGVPMAGRDEMLYSEKFDQVENTWDSTIVSPSSSIILARNAITLFKDFINALFDPELFKVLGIPTQGSQYRYNIKSGIREAVIQAGKARKLIRMQYHNKERDIEPYSFRYKWVKPKGKLLFGYGAEYFYGFDRTRGQHIKAFFLHEIQGVSILPNEYTPRWYVEL